MYSRWYEESLRTKLAQPFVHILFGARQTGKSTLLRRLLPPDVMEVDFSNPAVRSRHLKNLEAFIKECRSLPPRKHGAYVFVDEAQSVPFIFDAVQHLYDGDKTRWRFVLCGSSARRLRQTGANLLPGRALLHRLFPLTLTERQGPLPPYAFDGPPVLPLPWPGKKSPEAPFPPADLEERLAYGELPGVATAQVEERDDILRSYAIVHLEEEIRREATVKEWGAFLHFLRLAASESGGILNYATISSQCGLSQPTVKAHYQLLEDMFLGFTVPAWSGSVRKHLLSTPRFFFFDLGVRHAAAGLTAGPDTVLANPGPVFEQWVGIELWKRLRYLGTGTLSYLRTKDGAEVDFIVEHGGRLAPIEVKWTENPKLSDARHLLTFINEHPRKAPHGYIICRCDRPLRLHDKITALPWFCL